MDRDSEPNAGITYSLVPAQYQDQFSIDPKAGFISIKSQLDRESVSHISHIHNVINRIITKISQ